MKIAFKQLPHLLEKLFLNYTFNLLIYPPLFFQLIYYLVF